MALLHRRSVLRAQTPLAICLAIRVRASVLTLAVTPPEWAAAGAARRLDPGSAGFVPAFHLGRH